MIIIFSAFLIRILLATYSVEVAYLPGAGIDALNFHFKALSYSANYGQEEAMLHSKWAYSVFLGSLYHFFNTTSHLFSTYLSCIVWLLSAFIFREIMLKLNFENIKLPILLYAFAFPTSIIYNTATLREVYILLFFNLLALFIINIHETKNIKKKIFIILLFFATLWFAIKFHRGNVPVFLAFFGLMIPFFLITKFHVNKFFIFILCMSAIFYLDYYGYMEHFFNRILSYQSGHFHDGSNTIVRTMYYTFDDVRGTTYSIPSFFFYILRNLFNYLFQPTPFNAANLLDIVALFESILRLTLIIFILKKFFLQFNNKNIFNIFLIMLVVYETVYAQGTVNYGTATRHHVPVMGLLILISFFPFKKIR